MTFGQTKLMVGQNLDNTAFGYPVGLALRDHSVQLLSQTLQSSNLRIDFTQVLVGNPVDLGTRCIRIVGQIQNLSNAFE
jgi:hypothetical protein